MRFLTFLISFLLITSLLNAQPNTITYQGLLTDDNNDAITGTETLKFDIYNVETEGNSLWNETHSNVLISSGLFNIELGSVTPFGSLDFSQELWLEITVSGNTLSPRIAFNAVGYAMESTNYGMNNFTGSSYVYDSKTGVKLEPDNSSTNVDFVISPKGTGGIFAQQPDGTLVGGNNRGENAVDLQMLRGGTAEVASGIHSTISGGSDNTASGLASTVSGGEDNLASGYFSSISGGKYNTASGEYSTASGFYNSASEYCTTISGGAYNIASGWSSTVSGYYNTASEYCATVSGGRDNTASKQYSIVSGGEDNTASGRYSTVSGGKNNTASGNYSLICGNDNTAPSYGETVIGYYATEYTPYTDGATKPNAPDRLFVIGNGEYGSRRNALTMLKNANTIIGGSLTINGNGNYITFPTNRGTSGYFLKTNANGSTEWASAGLSNFTESNYTYDSKYGVKFTPNSSETNVDVIIQPKGTGGIFAQQPDGSGVGGNNRGPLAVDLQLYRDFNTEVASGLASVISGGARNTASAQCASVVGGFGNTASGIFTTVGGYDNTAHDSYETVFGIWATEGSGETSDFVLTDRLFVIGNGAVSNARSNALTILKNANTTIGGSLTINGNGTDADYTFPTGRGTDGQVLTTDGTGGTSWADAGVGLSNFTESNYTYDSKYGVKFTPNSSETNVDVVIQPKGTGGIFAQQPDGSGAGGNNRGEYAVDLQMKRFLAPYPVASGDYSVITGGFNNTASGDYSVSAGGAHNNSSQQYSFIGGGYANTAGGEYSTVGGGKSNTAGGAHSTVGGGSNNEASGNVSFIGGGTDNDANGSGSLVVGGYNNTASGTYSAVLSGTGNTSPSYGEVVIGYYASEYTPDTDGATQPNATDRLFVIGNGSASFSRSNALTMLKNANTTIGGSLTINGNGTDADYTFPTGRGTDGQVLTTDGTGGTSWADAGVGLSNFTESSYTYDSKYGVKLTPNSAQTNVDFVIKPKGTGAIIAVQPDGTDDTGGNARGDYAVDLQLVRDDKAQVASGEYSAILGGGGNTASAPVSFIGGGQYNTASGNGSSILGGSANTAGGVGSTIIGGGSNSSNGNYSISGGYHNTAPSYGETVLGFYATTYTPGTNGATQSNLTDRLFVIGNGSSGTPSDALVMYKNANTTIGGSLTINGNGTDADYTFPTGRGTDGQVLTTDGTGGTSWADAGGGSGTIIQESFTGESYDLTGSPYYMLFTKTVTGAAVGDAVVVNLEGTTTINGNFVALRGWVSASNTVSIKISDAKGTFDQSGLTLIITVIRN